MDQNKKVLLNDKDVEHEPLTYNSHFSGETEVVMDIQQYMDNGNLYIGIACKADGYLEPFANLTVNLGDSAPDYCSYVDTNNLPDAEEFITQNGLGTFTGFIKRSGFCEFPLYMFEPDKLRALCPDGLEMYEKSKGIVMKSRQKKETR